MRKFLLFLWLIHASDIALAAEFVGRVTVVLDGDTVVVSRVGKRTVKVRLVGIDAPEKDQEYGMASRLSLLSLVLNKQVKVSGKTVDDYGRLLAEISVNGLSINQEQVRRGMAWNYSRSKSNPKLEALQLEARRARRGLWSVGSAIEPSEWRKLHPVASSPVPETVVAPQPVVDFPACRKKQCIEMTSCVEAKYYLAHCQIKALDGDGDGIPCELLCEDEKK